MERRRTAHHMGGAAGFRAALAVLAVTLTAAGGFWWYSQDYEATDNAFIEADIAPVNPKVAGMAQKVLVSDNQDVAEGETLVVVDPRDIQAKVDAAKAGLEVARAAVETAKARLLGSQADVQAAEAEATRRRLDLERYQGLDPRVRMPQQLDGARAAQQYADAVLRAAQTKSVAAQAQIGEAQAHVRQAEAAVNQAELDLSYTLIKAPAAGRITRKSVKPGQYVTVGQMLMAVVPPRVWVVANFKETQLGRMRRGQSVDIKVDAYPDRKFKGVVNSIQAGTGSRFSLLPPENATGNYVKVVQRIPVKILFLEQYPDVLLAPGMSVVPTVHLDSAGEQIPLPVTPPAGSAGGTAD